MITPLIALAVLLQPSPAKVTLTVAAAPLPDVVQQIAEATGADLRVAPGLAEVRVGVRLQDVPLETVKAKLADALRAEWKPEDSGFRLTAPSATTSVTERMAEIQAYLDRQPTLEPFTTQEAEKLVRDALRAQEEMGERYDWERIQAIDARVPINRASTRIAQAVGARALADLKEGDRVVYSTAPTRMQKAMPPAMAKAMADLQSERAIHSEVLERLSPRGSNDGRNYMSALHSGGSGSLNDTGPSVSLVVLARQSDNIRLELRSYDAQGNMRSMNSTFLNIAGLGETPARRVILQGSDAVYQPTETAKAFSAMRPDEFGPNSAVPARSPEARARVEEVLKDLVKHEPLAWGIGDLFRQASENHGLNLVAVYPDVLALYGPFLAGREAKTDELVNDLSPWMGDAATVKDGWLVLQESSLPFGNNYPLPRKELSTFIRATIASGGIRLDPLADFIGALHEREDMSYAVQWPQFLWPDLSMDFLYEGGSGLDALRLYSRLDSNTRRLARRPEGVTIRYGQMGSRARTVLDRLLFAPDWNTTLRSEPADFDAQYFSRGADNLATEPTVAFAGGVPPMATITVRVRDRGAIYAQRPESARMWRSGPVVTAEAIAQDLTMTESPWFDPANAQGFAPYDRFAMGSMEQLELTGVFGEGLHLGLRFQLPATPPDDKWVGFDGLPEEVRKEILDQVEALRKQYKEMRESGQNFRPSGGARPPVP